MKILVMGSGGVGGYFGAKLAAGGAEVSFIARGAHLAAMAKNGLKVISPETGDVHLPSVNVSDTPADLGGPFDVIMVCVKLWDVAAAGESLKSVTGPDTVIIPFENGVESEDILGGILGAEKIMGGVAHISSRISQPGVITHNGPLARLFFGELAGGITPRGEAFYKVCEDAGLKAKLSDNINSAIWDKFIFLTAFSGMTALTRLPIGPIRENPQTRKMFFDAMAEATRVAKAKGVEFAEEPVALWEERIEKMPPTYQASMLEDLLKGRRLELPWLSGAVARMGADLGVPMPVASFITTALILHADGA